MWHNWNSHTLLVEVENGADGNSMAVPQMAKHGFSYDPAIPLLGVVPKEMDTCSHKNLYTDAHRSIIHHSPKVETTQMSVDEWIKKKWYIHTIIIIQP